VTDILHAYVASYRDAIAAIRYRDVVGMQQPPHASMAHGGIGTAYALWRLGETRRARAWLRDVATDRRGAAYTWPAYTPPAASYHYGRGGLHWMRCLAGERRAIESYLRLARGADGNEIMAGAAGHLTGIRLLLARGDDDRLRRTGEALAAKLVRGLRTRARRPWEARDAAGGFAHDWLGVLHALLEWARARGEPPPAIVVDVLEALAAVWSPDVVRHRELVGAWCQGAAGAALVWASAFATTRDDQFLRCARDAGRIASEAHYAVADLCCGWAGACFALLELDRIDRDGAWKRRATELAIIRIGAPAAMQWPNGLFRGHPGLVCLALDLVEPSPRGFPTILG
jgi:hypothetical protein